MMKTIMYGIAVVLVLLFAGSLITMTVWPIGGHMLWMMGMMPFSWGFMLLVPLLFLTLLAAGLYYLFTGFSRTGRFLTGEREDALEILKKRYAKGELTTEQYLKMKEELK